MLALSSVKRPAAASSFLMRFLFSKGELKRFACHMLVRSGLLQLQLNAQKQKKASLMGSGFRHQSSSELHPRQRPRAIALALLSRITRVRKSSWKHYHGLTLNSERNS